MTRQTPNWLEVLLRASNQIQGFCEHLSSENDSTFILPIPTCTAPFTALKVSTNEFSADTNVSNAAHSDFNFHAMVGFKIVVVL